MTHKKLVWLVANMLEKASAIRSFVILSCCVAPLRISAGKGHLKCGKTETVWLCLFVAVHTWKTAASCLPACLQQTALSQFCEIAASSQASPVTVSRNSQSPKASWHCLINNSNVPNLHVFLGTLLEKRFTCHSSPCRCVAVLPSNPVC